MRINPLQLRIMVHIINTTILLYKSIVPRNHTSCRKSLGNEIKFLFQHEISSDASSGRSHGTTQRNLLGRVGYISRSWQISPRAIAILRQESIWRNIICTSPLLADLPIAITIRTIYPRSLALTIRASKVHLEHGGLCDVEVEIRTNIHTIVVVTCTIVTTIAEILIKVTLAHEIHTCKVLHKLGTTRYIHIGIV